MAQPDLQQVAFVAVQGSPEDAESRMSVTEIDLGIGAGLGADEVIDDALKVIAPNYYRLEERRFQQNWGATGLQAQDIEILYAIGIGVELSAAAIIQGFSGLKSKTGRRRFESADAVAARFEEMLTRRFNVRDVRLESVEQEPTRWVVTATAGGFRFEGSLTKDGRLAEAKRSVLPGAGSSVPADGTGTKTIELVLPTGERRTLDVDVGTSAGDAVARVQVAGYQIVASDGRILFPEDDLYSAVEAGQTLNMAPSPTGGKGGVEVSNAVDDPGFWRVSVLYQLVYSLAGLVAGLAFVLAGVVLFFHGVTGSTGWIAEAFGVKSTLTDAPPGVVLFVAGFMVVVATGYRVKPSRR